jgi:hypothetical protein
MDYEQLVSGLRNYGARLVSGAASKTMRSSRFCRRRTIGMLLQSKNVKEPKEVARKMLGYMNEEVGEKNET